MGWVFVWEGILQNNFGASIWGRLTTKFITSNIIAGGLVVSNQFFFIFNPDFSWEMDSNLRTNALIFFGFGWQKRNNKIGWPPSVKVTLTNKNSLTDFCVLPLERDKFIPKFSTRIAGMAHLRLALFPNSSFDRGILHVTPTKSLTFSPGDLRIAMLSFRWLQKHNPPSK